jgi:metal-responsive CopG/Arc/MetJ family transcriptional regulator
MENLGKSTHKIISVSVPSELLKTLEKQRAAGYESRSSYFTRLLKSASSKQDTKN